MNKGEERLWPDTKKGTVFIINVGLLDNAHGKPIIVTLDNGGKSVMDTDAFGVTGLINEESMGSWHWLLWFGGRGKKRTGCLEQYQRSQRVQRGRDG